MAERPDRAAIGASLARIPAGVPAFVPVEVDGPEDEIAPESPGDLVAVLDPGREGALLDAVRGLTFTDGPGAVTTRTAGIAPSGPAVPSDVRARSSTRSAPAPGASAA